MRGALDFSRRSSGVEIMDDLSCSGDVVEQTLRELDAINKWLGGNAVTLNSLRQLLAQIDPSKTVTIADLGCGSGEMLRLIARIGSRGGRKLNLIGVDANPNIIRFAKQHSGDFPEIRFEAWNVFSEEFQKQKFDIVLATLFLHHFSPRQLDTLFRQLKEQTKLGVIVNDIHRHPVAYHAIRLLTSFFSKSPMVKFDAPLSVLRAFTKADLDAAIQKANFHQYSLRWKWAFRWCLVAKTAVS